MHSSDQAGAAEAGPDAVVDLLYQQLRSAYAAARADGADSAAVTGDITDRLHRLRNMTSDSPAPASPAAEND